MGSSTRLYPLLAYRWSPCGPQHSKKYVSLDCQRYVACPIWLKESSQKTYSQVLHLKSWLEHY